MTHFQLTQTAVLVLLIYFEMEKILIEKVREHEMLYNQVAPSYRDQNMRQEAWDKIGKELQITGEQPFFFYLFYNLC